MGSMFQNLDPWLLGIAKKKGKFYATKRYHYLLMTRLACDQLGSYFLCHNHAPVFYHQSSFTLERSNISLNLGLSNPLETIKKLPIFSSLCHCRETQLQWYSNYFVINVNPSINCKEWCPLFGICVCIYILRASDRDVKAYTFGI